MPSKSWILALFLHFDPSRIAKVPNITHFSDNVSINYLLKDHDYISRSMLDSDPAMLQRTFLDFLENVDLENLPEYNRERQQEREKVAREKLNVSFSFRRKCWMTKGFSTRKAMTVSHFRHLPHCLKINFSGAYCKTRKPCSIYQWQTAPSIRSHGLAKRVQIAQNGDKRKLGSGWRRRLAFRRSSKFRTFTALPYSDTHLP